jgi:4-amino-4-deoxy-L-arabinose transferase-like glycosyltransferase
MASAADTINGRDVILSIATNLTTPVYKDVVCSIDNGLTGSSNVQTSDTKCGQAKARGTSNRTVTGNLAANTAPLTAEMSAEDLDALFESGVDFLFKLDDGADYYRAGTGFLSTYNETANTGDVVKADFVIEVKGAIDSSR